MDIDGASTNTVKSVHVALQIIETLRKCGGMGVTALASELDLPKSTAHRYLKTLAEREYLIKEGDTYHIGLRFLDIGEFSRSRREGFEMVKPKVRKIAQKTGEKAQFIVEEHGKAVYMYQATGDQAVQLEFGVGARIQLHSTAAGKAIMAQWPEERIEGYIDTQQFSELTSNTITDHAELLTELEQTRERGYGLNDQEHIEGFIAVGVPIFDSSERVLGALSVGGPANRLQGNQLENEVVNLLLGMSNELELNLRYS
jgi:DNA-binding IclR family transcriptional regulator